MERRNWLWKKKSSDKVAAAPEIPESINDEINSSKVVPEVMPIPEGLQLEEVVKLLNEKLAVAQSEIQEKDAIAKQHMKVAEEAVTGWEKSESEAATWKKQLEEALQKKSALEDRILHLDNALKECVRQLRLVREEQEQKIHETVARKTKEWEKLRSELEEELAETRSQLTQSGVHANAVSKSLQERTMTILELNDAKVRAEMESRNARSRLECVEKEYATLKYDLQVLQRELEIRNEEREYSQKMVEAANKQQIENVKKTDRLEAECQRLRMLLKKKLPGPGALAQMRIEAEPEGPRRKLTATRSAKNFYSDSSDAIHLDDKENEFLSDRLRAMEEETTLLKEILARKTEELQESRLMCAKTASKLSNVEEQLVSLRSEKECQASSESANFHLMDDFIEMERLAADNKGNGAEAALSEKEKEIQHANGVCAELREKLAVAEQKLRACRCGTEASIQETVDVMMGLGNFKGAELTLEQRPLDVIDTESKARLRSAVGRIIHLVESMAQEYYTDSSSETESQGSDGVKRLVAVSKNLLQGKVPVLDFIAELSRVLDFVVGGSLLGRMDSPKSSEHSQRPPDAQEVLQLKSEIANLESSLKASTDTVNSLRAQLAAMEEERCLLQRQVSSAQEESKNMHNELATARLVKDKLEARVSAADVELHQLCQDIASLRNELQEEQKRHQDALQKLQMLQQQSARCEESSIAVQKEQELVAAAEKLAECQRTIHALGKQLETLGLPASSSQTPTRHFSRISELPKLNSEHDINRDYIQRQETYWTSAPMGSDIHNHHQSQFQQQYLGRQGADMFFYSGPQPNLEQEVVEIPTFQAKTPARYYRKSKPSATIKTMVSNGDLSKSLDATDLIQQQQQQQQRNVEIKQHSSGGVLGLGKLFSRGSKG